MKKYIPKSFLFFWCILIAIIILILIFIYAHKSIVVKNVIFTEMDFIAQMTFTEYKQKGYFNLVVCDMRDIGPIDTPLYKNFKRTMKISKDFNKDIYRLDLAISKNGYRRVFTEKIIKKDEE